MARTLIDELTECLERDDPRTVPQMMAEDPYSEFVVEKVEHHDDGTTVTFDGSLCTFLKGPQVNVGDTVWLYDGGNGGWGGERHGWALNGEVVEWATPFERVAKRVEWLAKHDRDKRERFEKERAELDAKYEALPEPLKARIDRFRAENPAFRVESESYEMYAVADAAVIAEHLRPRVDAGEDPADVVKAFYDLPWEQQKAIGIQDGHSGNTFGGACSLARAVLAGEKV